MPTTTANLHQLWADAKYHYQWRHYALRAWSMRRKYPEQFSLDEVNAALDDMRDALRAAPLPAWTAWLAKGTAWFIAPLVAPFGTVL